MYPPLQEPFLDDIIRNMGSHLYNQNMSAYTGDGSLSHVSEPFENLSYDAIPTFQEEKATIMPSYGDPAMPIDIPSAAPVDPPFTPSTMPLAHIPGFSPLSSSSSSSYSSSSSSLASSWDDSPPWTLWSRVHSGVPSAAGQWYYTNVLDQESSNYHSSGFPPDGLGAFSGSLATSPGLDTRASTGGKNVRQGQYSAIHTGRLADRPVLKRQKTADQMGVQGTYDRRVTCTVKNCGKSFSGEWEKMRHIKSLHHPPTIGCRDCNYKQSRKDLFSEHCRKRHPGESVEELLVQLVDANGTRS